jgi:hypothetical protein
MPREGRRALEVLAKAAYEADVLEIDSACATAFCAEAEAAESLRVLRAWGT